jgi:hypothetical protein
MGHGSWVMEKDTEGITDAGVSEKSEETVKREA